MDQPGFTQQEDDLIVDSLFANLGETTLLLPMSAVAEVVMDVKVSDAEQKPDWLHGWVNWRNLKLPLVAFEQLLGHEKNPIDDNAKVLVLNTLGKAKGVEFFAILLQGPPHPARVSSADAMKTHRITEKNDYVKMKVELNERSAVIPDLAALERLARDSAAI